MDSRELRIGNLVQFEDRVLAIDTLAEELPTLDTIDYGIGVVTWQNLKPIKLTEEWLIKFDAIKKGDEDVGYGFILSDLILFQDGKGFYVRHSYISSSRNYIKYVHQLQNLYFALTGEELEIKKD